MLVFSLSPAVILSLDYPRRNSTFFRHKTYLHLLFFLLKSKNISLVIPNLNLKLYTPKQLIHSFFFLDYSFLFKSKEDCPHQWRASCNLLKAWIEQKCARRANLLSAWAETFIFSWFQTSLLLVLLWNSLKPRLTVLVS